MQGEVAGKIYVAVIPERSTYQERLQVWRKVAPRKSGKIQPEIIIIFEMKGQTLTFSNEWRQIQNSPIQEIMLAALDRYKKMYVGTQEIQGYNVTLKQWFTCLGCGHIMKAYTSSNHNTKQWSRCRAEGHISNDCATNPNSLLCKAKEGVTTGTLPMLGPGTPSEQRTWDP